MLTRCVQRSSLRPFTDALQALLQSEGTCLLAVISLWQGFAHYDVWLMALSDKDFAKFISFMDIVKESAS